MSNRVHIDMHRIKRSHLGLIQTTPPFSLPRRPQSGVEEEQEEFTPNSPLWA